MTPAGAPRGAARTVLACVQDALAGAEGTPVVLAVSGGRDSVVLLDAVRAVAPARVAGVATFDHATGAASRAAAAHVAELARAAGLALWSGRAPEGTGASEAAWRRARWAFLRRVRREVGGRARPALVATGHTADDQAETVLLRVLRGAGPRGLAAMAAPAPGIVRPLLAARRADVAAYAAARALRWVDDPGNASARHLRNRLRREVLPAVLRARPDFADALLAIGRSAAAWRLDVDAAADSVARGAGCEEGVRLAVPLARLAGYDEAALAVLWPALAARAGATLDRRGVARLAGFTARSVRARAAGAVPRGAVPLAGGATVTVERADARSPERAMVLRRAGGEASDRGAPPVRLSAAALVAGVRFGRWRFAAGGGGGPDDPWRVRLPLALDYVVRAWRPGDRMPFRSDGAARRVKRFLADRGVPAVERAGWPVVVALPADASADDASVARDVDGSLGVIVWIPGVRRSPAAPARPGEPGLDLICERLPDRPE